MRLTRWSRVLLGALGGLLVGISVVGAARSWSDATMATALVAGVFLFIAAGVGAVPRGSIKEGSLEWLELDKHPRTETLEQEASELRKDVADLRAVVQKQSDALVDYILSQERPPDDGQTDEERVAELEQAVAELSSDIAWRYYAGETYDDGVDVVELEKYRDKSESDLAREKRRQAARERFRLSAVDGGE